MSPDLYTAGARTHRRRRSCDTALHVADDVISVVCEVLQVLWIILAANIAKVFHYSRLVVSTCCSAYTDRLTSRRYGLPGHIDINLELRCVVGDVRSTEEYRTICQVPVKLDGACLSIHRAVGQDLVERDRIVEGQRASGADVVAASAIGEVEVSTGVLSYNVSRHMKFGRLTSHC